MYTTICNNTHEPHDNGKTSYLCIIFKHPYSQSVGVNQKVNSCHLVCI